MRGAKQEPTLLVADDEPEICEIIRALAEDLGFAVTSITEGSEVVDTVERLRPTVIVLDLRMPGADGVEIIRELGKSKCKSGILLLSGMDQRTLSSVQSLGKQLDLAIDGTLTKPMSIEAVESALRPYLEIKPDSKTAKVARPAVPELDFGLNILFQPEMIIKPFRNSVRERLHLSFQWNMDNGTIITGSRLSSWIKENGIGKGITRMVLAQALENVRVWSNQEFCPVLSLQLDDALLSDLETPDILAIMADSFHVPRELLGIEISEESLQSSKNVISDVMSRLRIKGFKIVLNAENDGEAILPQVDRLPIDQLTLNMSTLVTNPALLDDMEKEFLYSSLASMANQKDIHVCAANVTTQQQLQFVRRCNFNSARGQEISAPLAATKILPAYKDGDFASPPGSG